MAGERSYYEVLGVGRSASLDEVKRAYRAKAKQYHPDRNPDNPEAEKKFKEVQRAYDVLRDPKKREQYDQFGEVGVGEVHTDPRGQRVYEWGGGSSVRVDDLEEILNAFGGMGGGQSPFEQIFGQVRGRRGGRAQRGAPAAGAHEERRVELSFDQAVHGASLNVTLRSGSNGKSETLTVKIPPGVEDGQKIRLKGRGQPGRQGGPAGDLFLVCTVRPHTWFRRKGVDVYVDVPVSVAEAALGAKIEVPTIDGMATVTLPPGTASDAKLRLAGKGIRRGENGDRGDHYAVIKIVPPKQMDTELQELFGKLQELDPSDPRAQCPWKKATNR